jgi:hypothetical protein
LTMSHSPDMGLRNLFTPYLGASQSNQIWAIQALFGLISHIWGVPQWRSAKINRTNV